MKEKDARMLPGDFTKYLKVKNTKKSVQKPKGFFTMPEDLKGNQDTGERPFLVFYFDSKKEYEYVRKYYEILGTGARSHPDLDSHKLYTTIKKMKKYIKKAKKYLGNKK